MGGRWKQPAVNRAMEQLKKWQKQGNDDKKNDQNVDSVFRQIVIVNVLCRKKSLTQQTIGNSHSLYTLCSFLQTYKS